MYTYTTKQYLTNKEHDNQKMHIPNEEHDDRERYIYHMKCMITRRDVLIK